MKHLLLSLTLLASFAATVWSAEESVTVLPGGRDGGWTAKYFYAIDASGQEPADDQNGKHWYAPDYDDSAWGQINGPIDRYCGIENSQSTWESEYDSYWIRREFTLTSKEDVDFVFRYFIYDELTLYVNGQKYAITQGGGYNEVVLISEHFQVGRNVLAVKAHNNGGPGAIDFAIYQRASAPWATIENKIAGELWEALEDKGYELSSIQKLKITGTLNSGDFTVIRRLMTSLKYLDISGTDVTSLPYEAFIDMGALEYVNLPAGVTSMGQYAFSNCNKLYKVTFGGISDPAYNIVFPADFTSFAYTITSCNSLTALDLSAIKNAGTIQICYCNNLETVKWPETPFTLGWDALNGTKIEYFDITDNVSRIEGYAFGSSFKRINLKTDQAINVGQNAFEYLNHSTCVVNVPVGMKKKLALQQGWDKVYDIMREYGYQVKIGEHGKVYQADRQLANGEIIFHDEKAVVFTVTPDEGYKLAAASLNNDTIPVENNTISLAAGIFGGILRISFEPLQYNLSVSSVGNGKVSYNGQELSLPTNLPCAFDDYKSFNVQPDAGYAVKSITYNGEESVLQNGGVNYTTPGCKGNAELIVTFAPESEVQGGSFIQVTSNELGSVVYKDVILERSSRLKLLDQGSATFLVVPNTNCRIGSILLNGEDASKNLTGTTLSLTGLTGNDVLVVDFISNKQVDITIEPGNLYNNLYALGIDLSQVENLSVRGSLEMKDYRAINVLMTGLKHLDLSGANITTIIESAFKDNSHLVTVTLPSTVTIIQNQAFQNASALEYVYGGENIETINSDAFYYCSALKSVPYGEKISTIESSAFAYCNSLSGELIFPISLRRITNYAFSSCPLISKVDFSNCTLLQDCNLYYMFADCSSLKQAVLPSSGCTNISYKAFGNTSLETVSIPQNITRIENYAFRCSTLKSIYLHSSTPIDIETQAFENVDKSTCVIYVPTGSSMDYKLSNGWTSFDNIVEYGYKLESSEHGKVLFNGAQVTAGTTYFSESSENVLTLVPETGYEVDKLLMNGKEVTIKSDNTYTIDPTQLSGTFKAYFSPKKLLLNIAYNSGGKVLYNQAEVSSTFSTVIDGGVAFALTLVPDQGYFVKSVKCNDTDIAITNGGREIQVSGLDANASYNIEFAPDSEMANLSKITVSLNNQTGRITYQGQLLTTGSYFLVAKGSDVALTILPPEGGHVVSIMCNGTDITSSLQSGQLLLSNLQGNQEIVVDFFSPTELEITTTPGELYNNILLLGVDLAKVTSLTVSGSINQTDYRCINNILVGLKNLDLSGVETSLIPEKAFQDNSHLVTVTLPASVTAIHNSAFQNCSSLEHVYGTDNITTIYDGAFNQCSSLKELPYGDIIHTIGYYAFKYCRSIAGAVKLPGSLKVLRNSVFSNCTSITSVDMSQCTFESFEAYRMFENCTSLETITFPQSSPFSWYIDWGFLRNTAIKSLSLPDYIYHLGNESLNIPTLRSLVLQRSVPIETDSEALNGIDKALCTLYVPIGSSMDYKLSNGWSAFEKIVETGFKVELDENGAASIDGIEIFNGQTYYPTAEQIELSVIPHSGYHVKAVTLNSQAIAPEGSKYLIPLSHLSGTIKITFEINKFELQVLSTGSGVISLGESTIASGSVLSVDSASISTFALQPSQGDVVKAIRFNQQESVVQNGGSVFVTPAISRNSTLEVEFAEPSALTDVVLFNVTTGSNGTVEILSTTLLPQTSIYVKVNQKAVFDIKPERYYLVDKVILNGKDVTNTLADNRLTIENVSAESTLEVSFTLNSTISIHMENEGQLGNMLNDTQKAAITHLIVSGRLNSNDFKVMREEMPNLAILDMADADMSYLPEYAFCISNDWDNETGKKTLKEVVLPKKIENIGYCAFAGCSNLETVSFKGLNQLAYINGRAFTGTALKSIDLSDTKVTQLGDQFRYCSKLQDFVFPIGLTELGNFFYKSNIEEVDLSHCTGLVSLNSTFDNCNYLKHVVLPSQLKTIGSNTFSNCSALTEIEIPSSVTSIGSWAFYNSGLESIDLSSCNLTKIGEYSFYNCQNLASVKLPSTIETLDNSAFSECHSLTNIDLSHCQSLTAIKQNAFNWCRSLSTVSLPKSLETLGSGAFDYCQNLTSIDLSHLQHLTVIEESTFRSCRLESVVLPPNLEAIGKYAFEGNSLNSLLEIPSTVTSIGERAFASNQLAIVKVHANLPPELFNKESLGEGIQLVFVEEGRAETYKNHEVWGEYNILDKEVAVEIEVTRPGNLAIDLVEQAKTAAGVVTHLKVKGELNATDFAVMRSNMTVLYNLDMSQANVSSIPERAFYEKRVLMKVKLPQELLAIEKEAFASCSGLNDSIFFPEQLTSIGDGAFNNCSSLKYIGFNDNLQVIRSQAFNNCSSLKQELTLPTGLLSLGDHAFSNCRNLYGTVTFRPDFYQFMGSEYYWSGDGYAFKNCTGIETVDMSACEFLYQIPCGTFQSCTGLKKVLLPPYTERIDQSTFSSCSSLTNISFPNSLLYIYYNAFSECSSLKFVDLSECNNLGTIESRAFYNCLALETVNLPASVNNIGERAFANCKKLANLTAEARTPADLGEYVFENVKTGTCLLSIPTQSYYDYITAAQWGAFVQLRLSIDVTIDEGANVTYSNNADKEQPENAPQRVAGIARVAASSTAQGDAKIKDGSSLYVKEDETVTFYINPEENVSIKQVLFNDNDVTGQMVGNTFETPNMSEASSFKVLLNVDGPITVKELRLTESDVALKVAETLQLNAKVYPNNATNKKVLWSSSNEDIAKVNEQGVITGISAGTVTITATTEDGGLTQTCSVIIMSNDYYMITQDVVSFVGDEAVISLSMHNQDPVNGFQCDIYLPDGVRMQGESWNNYGIQLSDRANGHTLTSGQRSDGAYRVIVYSLQNNSFTGNEGEIIRIPITNISEAGPYQVNIKNIKVSGPNNYEFTVPDVKSQITFNDYPLGDSNGSGDVTVADATTSINYMLERWNPKFIMKAADINADGDITISDVSSTIDIVLERNYPQSVAQKTTSTKGTISSGNDRLFIEDFEMEEGSRKTIEVVLENSRSYSAFQCDIKLPESIAFATDESGKPILSLTDRRSNSHALFSSILENGSLRIVAVSMNNDSFNDNEKAILKIDFEALSAVATESLEISNIRMVESETGAEFTLDNSYASIVLHSPTSLNSLSSDRLEVWTEKNWLVISSPVQQTLRIIAADGKSMMYEVTTGENRFYFDKPGLYIVEDKKVVIK